MPPHRTKTATAPPTNHLRFDPWTTSATGHQVADSATSNAYRVLRQEKLARQFGQGGGDCTVVRGGIGTGAVEERGVWVEVKGDDQKGDSGRGRERERRQRDIRGMFGVGKASSGSGPADSSKGVEHLLLSEDKNSQENPTTTSTAEATSTAETEPSPLLHPLPLSQNPPSTPPGTSNPYPQIFHPLTIYINAPSQPFLSDHKLKHLLTLHGATISLSLSRRVTHIIVGKPNTRPGSGAGGGLAAGKLQREVSRAGCRAWKVVFVEWVLESIKAGRRLSEGRFALQMETRQRSVLAFAGR